MIFIYNISLFLYSFGIKIAALLGNNKARQWMEGRKYLLGQIASALQPGEKRLWFHCASLGEFEQGRSLIEELKKKNPAYSIVLTFFSPSGYEVQKNYKGADYIFYLPPDTRSNAKKFITLINPEKVFFIKYEFWHHYFTQLKQEGIPLYMVSVIFRKDQPFFKWYGGFFKNMLKCVTCFFVQDESSKNLLGNIGFTNVVVSGDTRFDRVTTIASGAQAYPVIEKFKDGKKLLIAGSTWQPDEDILVKLIENNPTSIEKFILAPHTISDAGIQSLYDRLAMSQNSRVMLYSKANEAMVNTASVLIIDNIGMLSSLYKYGNVAYIGGGFGVAVHNTLEAAVFGMPLFFGMNYKKFKEACDLVDLGAAFPIDSFNSLQLKLKEITGDEIKWNTISAVTSNYVKSKTGASEIVMKNV